MGYSTWSDLDEAQHSIASARGFGKEKDMRGSSLAQARRSAQALVLGFAWACAPQPIPRAGPTPRTASPPPATTSSAPALAAPPAPKPSLRPSSRAPAGNVGTDGPLTLETVAPDGGWVVFCQAQEDTDGDGGVRVRVGAGGALEGDSMARYFALGEGSGQRILDLLAYDGSGRWVVLRKESGDVLLDTQRNRELRLDELGFDGRSDGLAARSHRALSFDLDGRRLAYVRRRDKDVSLVLRELESGRESQFEAGPGELWRVAFDPAGQALLLDVVLDDTNKDHRLSWPVLERKKPRPCSGPLVRFESRVRRGDEPVRRIVPLDGQKSETVPGLVVRFGDSRIVREGSGKLLLLAPGRSSEIANAKCNARIVHLDLVRKQLVTSCEESKGRAKLALWRNDQSVALDLEIAAPSHDRLEGGPARLLALYPGSDVKLLDLESATLFPLTSGDQVLATFGTRALLRRKGALVAVETTKREESTLGAGVDPRFDVSERAPLVAASPYVVDLATARVLGRFAGRPLGLAPDGKVLVASGGDADGEALAKGPLVWRSPEPDAPAH
ncbi:MAG: hypothetical protein U0263_10945 [Polyangiaceae bacterium]